MGPLAGLYHCQYEKSATPPTPFRTLFADQTTKLQRWTRPLAFAALDAVPTAGGGWRNGAAHGDKCCMRPFCTLVPRPSVRHLLAHFCSIRGLCPRARELHHDWFGSRSGPLRRAGIWPRGGTGGG